MSFPNVDVVRRIWDQSPGHWAIIGTKTNGRWHDYGKQEGGDWPLKDQPHGADLYFGALTLDEPRRSNDNFVGAAVLFADLDPINPEALDITPTIAWETSPDSYQAVWFLDDLITDYEAWAGLNQRLTRYTEADPGGWMGSKALRWPGSLNWKRQKDSYVPVGRLLWKDGPSQDRSRLESMLPEVSTVPVVVDDDHPDPIHPALVSARRRSLQQKHWHRLGLRSRSMVTRASVRDRSLFLAMAARNLLNDGLSPEDVFHLLWVQPYCKWRTDRDAPHVLWREIQKAAGAL